MKPSKVCPKCNKEFKTWQARTGHMYIHNKKVECEWCSKEHTKSNLSSHQNSCWNNPKNIRHCNLCGKQLTKIDSKKFCNTSCAATHNNTGREVTWGDKTSKTINKYFDESEYYRNIEKKTEYNYYYRSVQRRSRQQLKHLSSDEYKRYKSDVWNVDTNPNGLIIDHDEQVFTHWCKGSSVEEASDISNLQVITQKENLNRQRGYSPKNIWEQFRSEKYIHGNATLAQ